MANQVFLVGNLTQDPTTAVTTSGVDMCRFSIAVKRTYGEKETDFFNITTWRGLADNCAKYLKKGSKVAIIGSLQNRSYEDKDGIKRNVTDIIAREVEFLSARSSVEHDNRLIPVDDSDLPF